MSILCYSCADCLGELHALFELAKKGYYIEESKKNPRIRVYDPKNLTHGLDPGALPEIGFILDALGTKLRCCRIHVMTPQKYDLIE